MIGNMIPRESEHQFFQHNTLCMFMSDKANGRRSVLVAKLFAPYILLCQGWYWQALRDALKTSRASAYTNTSHVLHKRSIWRECRSIFHPFFFHCYGGHLLGHLLVQGGKKQA